MRPSTTYGMRICDLGLCWLALERRDRLAWRLTERDRVPVEVLESKRLIRGLSKTLRKGAGVLPGSAVKTAVVRLPRLRGKELRAAALGWVAREEKLPAERLAVTWRVLDDAEAGAETLNVFLAYALRDVVDAAMAQFGRVELEPELLLPDFMILDQCLRTLRPELNELSAWALVHLDQRDSFIGITMNGSPLLHRALPKDLSDGAEPEAYVGRLATEIHRSLSFARQTEQSPNIGGIFVSGDPALTDLLAAELRDSQPVPVTPWSLDAWVDTGGEVLPPRATVPMAAAILTSLKERPYNLLPERSAFYVPPARRMRLAVGATAAVAAALPLLTAGALLQETMSERRVESARRQLEMCRPAIDAAMDADRRYRLSLAREDVIATHGRHAGLEQVLLDVARRTPPQISFESLELVPRGDGLVLQLVGESADDRHAVAQQAFLDFVAALDACERLDRTPLPGRLVIDEVDAEHGVRKRVDFSLEYRVIEQRRNDG
ncbi:MAG TPA: hypothetical protein P5571_11290 [Candidatus Krumholzibacteria bacterium]|nr:hypothetical protein [Candidatus Krumholzibacteria bacterium]